MRFSPAILLFPFLLLPACTVDDECLQGAWQAVAFYENSQKSDADLRAVRLEFGPAGHYRFFSSGGYVEEGAYRISMQYVFFNDTTSEPPQEHIVKVLYLSPDTLKLRMQLDTVEQVIFLARPDTSVQTATD